MDFWRTHLALKALQRDIRRRQWVRDCKQGWRKKLRRANRDRIGYWAFVVIGALAWGALGYWLGVSR